MCTRLPARKTSLDGPENGCLAPCCAGSLDAMFALYKQLLPSLGGYLTHAGELNRGRLEVFMQHLAEAEADVLQARAEVRGCRRACQWTPMDAHRFFCLSSSLPGTCTPAVLPSTPPMSQASAQRPSPYRGAVVRARGPSCAGCRSLRGQAQPGARRGRAARVGLRSSDGQTVGGRGGAPAGGVG